MSENIKVLIVDDDEHIAELISLYLAKESYDTLMINDGRVAVEKFMSYKPDLCVLDLMLPGVDGYKICTEIRKTSNVPVLMLTAKGEVFDKVLGLELGADDYMVKPFDPKELVARVKAILRRTVQKPDEDVGKILRFSNLEINLSNYTVIYYGKKLEFPPKEFEVLCYLAEHKNQVFTREQLLDRVWGYEYLGDTRTVDVHIKRIREKFVIEDDWSVKTVWGVGYKFETA